MEKTINHLPYIYDHGVLKNIQIFVGQKWKRTVTTYHTAKGIFANDRQDIPTTQDYDLEILRIDKIGWETYKVSVYNETLKKAEAFVAGVFTRSEMNPTGYAVVIDNQVYSIVDNSAAAQSVLVSVFGVTKYASMRRDGLIRFFPRFVLIYRALPGGIKFDDNYKTYVFESEALPRCKLAIGETTVETERIVLMYDNDKRTHVSVITMNGEHPNIRTNRISGPAGYYEIKYKTELKMLAGALDEWDKK